MQESFYFYFFYYPVASTTDESLVQKPILNNIKNKIGSD